jgi:hypothetical protein
MIRFERALRFYPDVCSLLGSQFGELYAKFSEVKSCHFFVEVLG